MKILDNLDQHDIFVCGLIGSGKDSIVNAIIDQHYGKHFKIRIAGNIKGIIQDIYGFNNDELEFQKRNQKIIRQMHHDISKFMDEYPVKLDAAGLYGTVNNKFQMQSPTIVSNNRVMLIARKQSIEFENKIENFIVPDVRSYNEIKIMFENNPNVVGIFLLRSTDSEYINKEHWTNKLDYDDDNLIELLSMYKNNVVVVDNSIDSHSYKFTKFKENFEGKIVNSRNLNLNLQW